LILKKDIYALEQGDPGCIQCRTVFIPEAGSLPESLSGITPAQRKQVTATMNTMMMQFQQLARAGQITASQAQLLLHQGQLVLNALRTTAAG
jgi:hypothetical protein